MSMGIPDYFLNHKRIRCVCLDIQFSLSLKAQEFVRHTQNIRMRAAVDNLFSLRNPNKIICYTVAWFLQVGKFMKCKWHSEVNDGNFPGSPSEKQSALTTVSHSCQVFVTHIR